MPRADIEQLRRCGSVRTHEYSFEGQIAGSSSGGDIAAPSQIRRHTTDELSRIRTGLVAEFLAGRKHSARSELVEARQFTWHRHPDVDEIFCVLSGSLTITSGAGGEVVLGPGSVSDVVPRGVERRPDAGDGCEMVLLEPEGVPNTGDARRPAHGGRPVGLGTGVGRR